jgi:hypothetical protein
MKHFQSLFAAALIVAAGISFASPALASGAHLQKSPAVHKSAVKTSADNPPQPKPTPAPKPHHKHRRHPPHPAGH